jgi:hypothetical protein
VGSEFRPLRGRLFEAGPEKRTRLSQQPEFVALPSRPLHLGGKAAASCFPGKKFDGLVAMDKHTLWSDCLKEIAYHRVQPIGGGEFVRFAGRHGIQVRFETRGHLLRDSLDAGSIAPPNSLRIIIVIKLLAIKTVFI